MIDQFYPLESLYITIPVFLIAVFLMKNILFHLLDPFLIPLFSLSSSIGLMLWYYSEKSYIGTDVVLLFILFFVLFLIGVNLGHKIKISSRILCIPIDRRDVKRYLIVVITMLLAIYSLMAATLGIVLFQDDPEIARITLYQDGGGIYRRILPNMTFIATLMTVINYHIKNLKRTLSFIIIAGLSFISLTLGGKSGLLPLFIVYIYSRVAFNRLKKSGDNNFSTTIKALALFVSVIIGALIVLILSVEERGSLDYIEAFSVAVELLLNRIVAFGDISYFYFDQQVNLEGEKRWWDFPIDILNNPMGFFRLTEYEQALGAKMYSQLYGLGSDNSIGPNSQLFFVAMIYFGPLVGMAFTFVIGLFCGLVRRYLIDQLVYNNGGIFSIIFFILINFLIVSLPTDIFLTMGNIFDITMILLLTVPLAMILKNTSNYERN